MSIPITSSLCLNQLRKVALEAVKRACVACVEIQSSLVNDETISKNDKSPVTVGDYTVQALIIDELSRMTKEMDGSTEYDFVAEEDADTLAQQPLVQAKVLQFFKQFAQQDRKSTIDETELSVVLDKGRIKQPATKRWWTLDPIDGTLGFLRRDQYAIALALMEDNEPVLGVLGCPSLPLETHNPSSPKGCIFVAQRGRGSFMIALGSDAEQQINVSSKSDPSQAIFTESFVSRGFGHELNKKISTHMGVTKDALKIDSQCKYAMVARGDSDVYVRLTDVNYKECIWDHAAGQIVVEEAGGIVRDFKGNKLDYSVGRLLSNNVGIDIGVAQDMVTFFKIVHFHLGKTHITFKFAIGGGV
ncbi:3'(2'),5'-bisphosphate nucleotidase [Cavenderia fasciculata]|uniref:3'(2'),5'-bisphosphate nucleotidase n=1 Tax=Cavenderia fasciculata TaxID=261658 RepID=F4PU06_CACFS|nr:3'(2'),5'-bisphosphate nucleotidase [Cavenderia fasciculata]EGG21774.1 3'(2'),5'-bisphosphate nucleotidase [Cavenderia fasciculata]|eukprot:XP_004359624.1 3'(2'),5'-bisphosphate nucleotidase [Cavenderia fasciculata]